MSVLSVNCYSIMIVFDIVHSDDYRAASKTTCRDFLREQRFALTIAAVWLPHCFKYNLPRCSPRAEVCADNSHSMIRATSKTTCRDVRREQRFSLIIAAVWLPRCFKENLPRFSPRAAVYADDSRFMIPALLQRQLAAMFAIFADDSRCMITALLQRQSAAICAESSDFRW